MFVGRQERDERNRKDMRGLEQSFVSALASCGNVDGHRFLHLRQSVSRGAISYTVLLWGAIDRCAYPPTPSAMQQEALRCDAMRCTPGLGL